MKLPFALIAASLLATTAVGTAALASSDAICKPTPSAQWRTQADVKSAAEALGYQVANIKIEDNCYEVYARTKAGKKVEVYFDPASLNVVTIKDKS